MPVRFELEPLNKLKVGRFVSANSTRQWKTSKGIVYQWAFMDTSHLYFCFQMIYDSVAEMKGEELHLPRARADGQGLKYSGAGSSDKLKAATLAAFAKEIELRGDLPEHLEFKYRQILFWLTRTGPAEIEEYHDVISEYPE